MSKIAIISDIHGNKEALLSIINDIKSLSIDEVICLGDIIGIGPNPSECLDLIINNNIKTVLGNHELYFLKGTDIDNNLEEGEINHQNWIKSQITDRQKQYLENCDLTIKKNFNSKSILFEHFLIDNDSINRYPFYDLSIIKDNSIKDILDVLDYDFIFIGHEHNEFIIDNKLYDVGSSGCRKDNKTRYTIFDTDSFEVKTKIVEYDRGRFEQDLLVNDYPDRKLIAKWFFGIEL